MKKILVAAALAATAALGGCVQNYAEREVSQGAAPSVVTIVNAPAEARVIIGGRDHGSVAQNANGIALTTGRHDVRIVYGDSTLHSQAVFLSAGARVQVRVP